MSKHHDKSCIFRESFESELAVRKNGGVPSANNLIFYPGYCKFKGYPNRINYNRNYKLKFKF